MLELVREAFTDPFSVVLVALAIGCMIGLRTRFARWVALGSLGVVVLALLAACFDGQPHVTPKLDATTLVWARVVTRRAVSGLVLVALALPLSRVAAAWGALSPWWLAGTTMGLAPGIGLLASSALLLSTLRRLATDSALAEPERLGIFSRAIYASHGVLAAAVLVAMTGSISLVRRRYRTSA